MIDNDGNVLNHFSYDSFGNVTVESNPDVDFRFGYTGREFDEKSGLYYYRARYYDPAVGQFISEDPIEFAGGDDNLYGYVGNSPANYVDPTGLIPPPVAGALIGGGLDLGVQLLTSEGDFGERLSNVDWVSVGGSALSGAAGVGLTNRLIGKGASLTTRVLGSGTVGAGVDGLLIGPASDAIKGNPITACSILQDAAIGFAGGSGGELLGELITPSIADDVLENLDDTASAGLNNIPKPGSLTGNLNEINPTERGMVEELLNQGKNVELVPRGSTKTPDFLVDGVPTELKTLESAGKNTLKNAIQKASEQGQQVLVDARNVPITAENAHQQILRAQGNLTKSGKSSLSGRVTVLTKDGPVRF